MFDFRVHQKLACSSLPEPLPSKMLQQRCCWTLRHPLRLRAHSRCGFFSVFLLVLALLAASAVQKPHDSLRDTTQTGPLKEAISNPPFPPETAAAVEASATHLHADTAELYPPNSHVADEEAWSLSTERSTGDDISDSPTGATAASAATAAFFDNTGSNDVENIFRFPPMTITIVVGAAEAVRDCNEEAPSQSFLMTIARRFQQLQLLPLLVALGQQSLRVVTSHTRIPAPHNSQAAPRALQTESLLLHRDGTPWEQQQPQLWVEVASPTPLLQKLFWGGTGGIGAAKVQGRNVELPPVHFWPPPTEFPGRPGRAILSAETPHMLLPQTQRNMQSSMDLQQHLPLDLMHPGALGDLQQQQSTGDTAAALLGGSFVGGIMNALASTPLVRVNLGDMACAALPTSALHRKLSCWLLGAFTDRILCRTAWYDTCQAVSDEASLGKPLLSPVMLPPGGPPTLDLPLRPLLRHNRVLPKKIPREVVDEEGATYQLLWQALTRLDDIWALAYCGREAPAEAPLTNMYLRNLREVQQQTASQNFQQQQTLHAQGSRVPSRGTRGAPRHTGVGIAVAEETAQSYTHVPDAAPIVEGQDAADVYGHLATATGFPTPADNSQAGPSPTLSGHETPHATGPPPQGDPSAGPANSAESGELHWSYPPPGRFADGLPPKQAQDLLPGWRTELVLKALSPGVGNRTNVLAVAGRRGSEVLIAFRGTKTQVEWILNGQAEHAFRWLAEGEGRTAAGFSHIFSAAWPALQVYLASINKPEAPLSRILVTGYSLGGAVAALMAYGIALSYPLKVDAVIFGSPRTGDAAFSAAWARKVNGRVVAFTLDPIPRTPCREMPACDKSGAKGPLTLPAEFRNWDRATPRVSTTGAGNRLGGSSATNNYGDFYGLVSFGPEELGGSSGPKINPVYVSYNHICTYPCWLATNFNPKDPRTLCEMPDPEKQWSAGLSPDTCPALLS